MAFSFLGGIHPKENKHYAENYPVQDFPAPDVLVIPMAQHIGAPCKPLVKSPLTSKLLLFISAGAPAGFAAELALTSCRSAK